MTYVRAATFKRKQDLKAHKTRKRRHFQMQKDKITATGEAIAMVGAYFAAGRGQTLAKGATTNTCMRTGAKATY